MSFPCAWLKVIVLFCALSMVRKCAGLIVLRHQLANGHSRNLTCLSEDDDSAFIWNYNPPADGNNRGQVFEPEKPSFKNVTGCAFWSMQTCVAQWEKITGWDVVNSAFQPMAPVLDYRWEDFEEFVSHEDVSSAKYQYVGKISDSSDTAVFSARGLRDVYIALCRSKYRMEDPCVWIILGKSRNMMSQIQFCPKGASPFRQSSTDGNCKVIDKQETRGVLNAYEWRTFTLKWTADQKKIQVYKDTDNENEPFLQGYLDDWYPLSHINVKSGIETRVRFHFYQYLATRNEGVRISTIDFNPDNENFCTNLLVGLCPKCKLNFNLVDSVGGSFEIGTISGNEKSLSNGMLTWRSIKLKATSQVFASKRMKMEIQTIFDGDEGEGHWAIDSFRSCRSIGDVRKSTITIHREKLPGVVWPQVNCQKLSYGRSDLVESISTNMIDHDEKQLQELICRELKSSDPSSMSSSEKWSVCNEIGCTQDREFSRSKCSEVLVERAMNDGQFTTKHLVWLIALPVFAICVVGLFLFQRHYKMFAKHKLDAGYVEPNSSMIRAISRQPREASYLKPIRLSLLTIPRQLRQPSYLELDPKPLVTMSTKNWKSLHSPKRLKPQGRTEANRVSKHLYALPNTTNSRSVSVEYFEEYAEKAAAEGLLNSQFMIFQRGLTKPCEYGRLPENAQKNRDRFLIPYDDSRVILRNIPGDPYSDYINASYIQGYEKKKAYIAAQSPKRNTVNDFWRMIWQEEVRVVCMLTNVVEDGKRKCEKYWPEVGTTVKFGDLLISNTNQHELANTTVRTFELDYHQQRRMVTHLHYTGWLSCGLPTSLHSFFAYLKNLRRMDTGNGPILVHCSTGDHRTGTLILCDICLRQASVEKVVDVVAATTRMRNSRANMVGTQEQYQLAHTMITEGIIHSFTNVLSTRIEEMRRRLPIDIQRLNNDIWHERALYSSAALRPSTVQNLAEVKLPDVVSDSNVVRYANLLTPRDRQSIQLNAVSVDGVGVEKRYFASWLPSPFTVSDFWRFVAEKKIKLIIILQCSDPRDPTCCEIMPDKSIVTSVPHIRVENETSPDEDKYFTREQLVLTDVSKEYSNPQSLTVLTCKGWGRGENGKPPPPATLVSLWRAAEKIPRDEGQSLVLCHDGVTGCGLYSALSFLLERMATGKECDVISAVKAVRRSRLEFVQSMVTPAEQFEYLYDAALNYVARFRTYDDTAMTNWTGTEYQNFFGHT